MSPASYTSHILPMERECSRMRQTVSYHQVQEQLSSPQIFTASCFDFLTAAVIISCPSSEGNNLYRERGVFMPKATLSRFKCVW